MLRRSIFTAVGALVVLPMSLPAQQVQEKSAVKVVALSTTSAESKDQWQAAVFNSWAGYGARATERLRALTVKDPSFTLAKAALGFFSGNRAQIDSAAADLSKLSLGEQLWVLILREANAGNGANALAIAKAAAEIYPDEPAFAMDVASRSAGADRKQAIENFRGVAERLKYAPAWRQISNRQLADGDTAAAIASAEAAMKLEPNSGSTHGWYARLHLLKGDLATARAHFEAAIKVSPDNGDVHQQLAELETVERNFAAAHTHVAHAIARGQTENEKLRFHRMIAVLYAGEGKYAEAWKELESVVAHAQAVGDKQAEALAHRNLASLAVVMKRKDYQVHLDAAAAANDPVQALNSARVTTYADAGNVTEAGKALEAFIAGAGNTPNEATQRTIHYLQGVVKVAEKDAAAALKHFEMADANNLNVQVYSVRAHKMLGHKAEAAQLKQKILARRDASLNSFIGFLAWSQLQKM